MPAHGYFHTIGISLSNHRYYMPMGITNGHDMVVVISKINCCIFGVFSLILAPIITHVADLPLNFQVMLLISIIFSTLPLCYGFLAGGFRILSTYSVMDFNWGLRVSDLEHTFSKVLVGTQGHSSDLPSTLDGP